MRRFQCPAWRPEPEKNLPVGAVAGDLTEIVQDRRADLISEGQFEWLPRLALANPDASVPPVNIVQRQGDNVVVAEGVAPNERIVLAGQMLVRPGGKVRVEGGSTAEPASNANSKANQTSVAGGQS